MSMTVSKILALRESKLQRVREDLSRKKNAVVEAESEEAAAREEAENYSLQMKNIETRLLESCVDEKNRRTDLTTIAPRLAEIKTREKSLWEEHQRQVENLQEKQQKLENAKCALTNVEASLRRLGEFENILIEQDRIEKIASEDAELDDIAEIMFARAGR